MAFRFVPFVAFACGLLRVPAAGQEGGRSPFLAAEIGNFPKCKVYGRTYCLESPDYPK
jgi:hypothetical protein